MSRPTLVFSILTALLLIAVDAPDTSACWRRSGRFARRHCCNSAPQQAALEPVQSAEPEPATPKPDPVKQITASQVTAMVEKAVWCRVSFEPRDHGFVLKADKMRKLVSEFLRPSLGGIEAGARYTYVWHIALEIRFLDQDGDEIGKLDFWTSSDKFFETVIHVDGVGGYLPHGDAARLHFKNAIKPAVFDFDNNCEALTSGKKSLVHASLWALVEKPFRGQANKAVERIEPFLKSKDRDTRELAARQLLELVPDHKGAKRVWSERKQ